MPSFNVEGMRFLPSPLEVLEEVSLPREGLIRAHILDPAEEEWTVAGYGFGWNKSFDFNPTETERLKVVEFALGETACDAIVAYILDIPDQEESHREHNEAMQRLRADLRRIHEESQRDHEQQILDLKKESARLDILRAAELTPDAVELIKREVMTENMELHFPESIDPQDPES